MTKKTAKKSAKVAKASPAKKTAAKKAIVKRAASKGAKGKKAAPKSPARKAAKALATKSGPPSADTKPKLLSGGNPQIAKGYGDAPVQAYIAAAPDWKQDICRRLDELVSDTVPNVRKAVKWNTPFYGVEDESQGWFLGFHCFAKYVKVTFFRGTSLRPVPVGESKHPGVRYLDVYEGKLDEAQFVDWVKQASRLPGEKL